MSSRAGNPPLLFILSGPAGVGKTALVERLVLRVPHLAVPVTATTRLPRPDEIPGSSYLFLTEEEYGRLLAAGELLAPATVHGFEYGLPLDELRVAFRRGLDVLVVLDVQGAAEAWRRLPQAVTVFLTAPSFDDLVNRLTARGTETGAALQRRIEDAHEELVHIRSYDYVIVNRDGELEEAVGEMACIITAERLRQHRPGIPLVPMDSPGPSDRPSAPTFPSI
jgi:guanylate kinase